MLRKLSAVGLVAAAALGSVLMAAPAQAKNVSDQQFNQNLQVVPIQICNANIAVAGVVIPILSPQTTGDCINGPVSTNVG
ncbi:hypothetical protein [Marinitenerispora sediminis]|uniref:Chaplin n=1 Tax=Marinitenerispora sediminis TaxID=1931232 RepID=A0A368T0P4_9ACTN|nr:hypothetical protein [Marinitenerispora sediminis]RCV52770.1 hypothetical protein DEF24_21535 [Marinitenerispora sediminis]RCV55589.1 hypothetical protein DEF28_05705 [Marinitenerispora sediminis]RCV61917.1 hypothetical protein DEF23_01145 [Marinitenerispora sediminis]